MNGKSRKILAFDIGGTKIAHALVDENGRLLTERMKDNTPKTASEIFALLKDITARCEDDIDAVGIATAGEVDCDNSRIIGSVGNMPAGYRDTAFYKLSGKPVFVENDANAVMWAEYKAGAAKGCKNALVIAIGTGLGLGVMVDGRLLKGKSGLGAEAHFGIARGKVRRCSCGNWDCYEVYASGTALGVDAQEAYHDKSKTSHDIIAGIQAGDKKAREVFDLWQDDVLTGIVGLANLFDPEVVLMFGGLTDYLDYERLEKEANSRIVTAPFKLCRARFEHNAALIGAALIALHNLEVK